jgi:hypothetical protein
MQIDPRTKRVESSRALRAFRIQLLPGRQRIRDGVAGAGSDVRGGSADVLPTGRTDKFSAGVLRRIEKRRVANATEPLWGHGAAPRFAWSVREE